MAYLPLPSDNVSLYQFSVSGYYKYEPDATGTFVEISNDTDSIDDKYVIKFNNNSGTKPTGKQYWTYVLNPEGYKFVRPRFIEAIAKYRPSYGRLRDSEPRYMTPITIEDVDAVFNAAWNRYLEATKKRQEKLKKQIDSL